MAREIQVLANPRLYKYLPILMKSLKMSLHVLKSAFGMKITTCEITKIKKCANSADHIGWDKMCNRGEIDL